MKKLITAITLAASLVFVSSTVQATNTSTLQGWVFDRTTAGLTGATVCVNVQPFRCIRSTATGFYRLDISGLPPAALEMTAICAVSDRDNVQRAFTREVIVGVNQVNFLTSCAPVPVAPAPTPTARPQPRPVPPQSIVPPAGHPIPVSGCNVPGKP